MSVHRLHTWALDDATSFDNVVIRPAGGGLPRRLTSAGGVLAMVAAAPAFLFLQPMEDSLADAMGGSPAAYAPGSPEFDGPSEIDGSRYLSVPAGASLTIDRLGIFDASQPWSVVWRGRVTSLPSAGQ